MALYLIGDIQGCDAALGRLLQRIDFSPSRDTLYLLGDLVNRGPANAAVLRRLMGYGDSARSLLGNHDLHLLSVDLGIRPLKAGDTVQDILDAPDRRALMDWLSQQPLALRHAQCLMVHAGVLPQWSAEQTLQLASEVSAVLKSPQRSQFLTEMYGNLPDHWHEGLQGMDRLRVIVNALTRLRFCTPQGQMEFQAKEGLDAAPEGFMPWFDVPNRQTAEVMLAFGHWSTAGGLWRPNVVCLDTGCVWGRSLSALRWTPGTGVDAVQQGEWVEEPAA